MKTAEALEAITDHGRFELLATSVLRNAKKEYASIIHTGVNAKGEPVKSALDGFCRVPGSDPALFLLVQHTTVGIKSLKSKWLYDHRTSESGRAEPADDGDLIKAAHRVDELRASFPNAKFLVILATNRRPNEALLKEVYEVAERFCIEVDPWDRSRLADFLDNTREGHWLRKKYLGIKAEMLSLDLLSSLCRESLRAFKKEVSHMTGPESWIPREIDNLAASGILSSGCTAQFLIGDSGSGKSSVAYQVLKRHIDSGGYGVWAEARSISGYTRPKNALDRVLRDLHPQLEPNAGEMALQLVQREKKRLLLVVDDVNRTHEPIELVRKIRTWSTPPQSDSNSGSLPLPYLIICPIWPRIWSEIVLYFDRIPDWVNAIFVRAMSPEEGMQAVQVAALRAGMELTSVEAGDLATRLGYDPILVGLFSRLLPDRKLDEISTLAENVFDEFMKKGVYEAIAVAKETYLDVEYHDTLSEVCLHMLKKRSLYPSWDEIGGWLRQEPDKLKQLRILIAHGMICRLGENSELIFRHDRIRDTLLVKALSSMLAMEVPDADILAEPFYAEIIGRALVETECDQLVLEQTRDRLPLALFIAIRHFGTPKSDYHNEIIRQAKQWVEEIVSNNLAARSVLENVCWVLIETDSPLVLELTEGFPKSPLVDATRLRNGCATSGILFFHDYWFPTSDNLRDRIIEQGKRRQKDQLLNQLKRLLTDANTESMPALTLAGFLGFTELKDEIADCWMRVTENRSDALPYAIWAATQCCGDEPSKFLDPLMEYWAAMSDERDGFYLSPKLEVAEKLRFAAQSSFSDNIIAYFVSQCSIHGSLLDPIVYMLSGVDLPDAVEFTVRSTNKQHALWYSGTYMQQWDVSVGRPDVRRLSKASMERLRTLWSFTGNDEQVRKKAFRLWLTGVESEQLEILRGIAPDSILHHYAVLKRAELGDTTVVRELIPILQSKAYHFRVSHYVWCNKLMAEAEEYLWGFKDSIPRNFSGEYTWEHWALLELLMRIPASDAETLLTRYWDHLGYSSRFIQTALYIGTPKCLELAASSIERCPGDIPIFEHIDFTFGFTTLGKHEYLTKQHLDNLLPYLDHFGQDELSRLADVCQRLGIPEWSQENVSYRLNERYRKHYHPSDDDLLEDLDGFAADEQGVWVLKFWLEEFNKRHDPKDRILRCVDAWLASHPTLRGLEIAATCIQHIGNRKDLSLLDKYKIEGPVEEITMVKTNARFSVYRRTLD